MTLPALSDTLRGPLLMTAATGAYVVNDSLMKLATEGLPPYEVLVLRGVFASLWGLPLLLILGHGRRLGLVLDPAVLLRNLAELGAILCYIVALAAMPIADVIAIGQVTPLVVILGYALILSEPVGPLRLGLIGAGFAGALMVAQPTGAGLSVYAVLALGNAVFAGLRDIVARRVRPEVPGLVVALSATLVVLAGAGVMHLVLEDWVVPRPRELALMTGAGAFLFAGHFLIFMAYRAGPARRVAPFFYTFSVWAVVSGILVFAEIPNPLALAGIVVVIASGLAVVLLDARSRRPGPAAPRA